MVELAGLHELVRRWEEAAEALENGSDDDCLRAVRSWIEEWDRRFWDEDFSGFEQIYTDDFIGRSNVPMLGTADLHGPDGFRELRAEVSDATSRFWFDIREVRRGPEGRFAGVGRMRLRGRFTGLVVQTPWAVVWQMRDRMLVEGTTYMNTRRALRELDAVPVG